MKYAILICLLFVTPAMAVPRTLKLYATEDTYVYNATAGNAINNSFGQETFMSIAQNSKVSLIKFNIPSYANNGTAVLRLRWTGGSNNQLQSRIMTYNWSENSTWSQLFGPANSTIPTQLDVLGSGTTYTEPGVVMVQMPASWAYNSYAITASGTTPFSIRTEETAPNVNLPRNYLLLTFDGPKIGDSNHDGHFNSSDYVLVFQANKYETGQPATFEEGDWNADGVFDSGDIVYAEQEGDYED